MGPEPKPVEELECRFKAILSAVHARSLKPLGFRKQGARFRLAREELVIRLDFKPGIHRTAEYWRFHVALGISVPMLDRLLDASGILVKSTDLGTLGPTRTAVWWNLTPLRSTPPEVRDDRIITGITSIADSGLRSYIGRFGSIDDLLADLAAGSGAGDRFVASRLHLVRGNAARARELWAEWVRMVHSADPGKPESTADSEPSRLMAEYERLEQAATRIGFLRGPSSDRGGH
jgi:hypothetical protein